MSLCPTSDGCTIDMVLSNCRQHRAISHNTLFDVVCSGVDAEYDQSISDIQSVEQALRDYLDQQKKILGCRVNK